MGNLGTRGTNKSPYKRAVGLDANSVVSSLGASTGLPLVVANLVLQYAELSPWELYLGSLAESGNHTWQRIERADIRCVFLVATEAKWKPAFGHFKAASDAGSAAAMCRLAKYYMFSFRATNVDFAEAERLLSRAAEAAVVEAPLWQGLWLGERYLWEEAPTIMRTAIVMWRSCSEASRVLADACIALAEWRLLPDSFLQREAKTRTLEKALDRLETEAKTDPVSQCLLCLLRWLYYRGCARPRNIDEARSLFLPAAKHGFVPALSGLATCYLNVGTKRSHEKAVKLLMSECAPVLDPGSLYLLSDCYCNGHGVQQAPEVAYRLCRQAAELGHHGAMTSLARYLRYASGCQQNIAESYEWVEKCAQEGNLWAQRSQGIAYLEGDAYKVDKHKAWQYFCVIAADDPWIARILSQCEGNEENLTIELVNKNRVTDDDT